MTTLHRPPKDCPNEEACVSMANDASKKWHFEKSVSMGHIVTTLVALISFVYWAMKQEGRLSRLEEHSIIAAKADEDQNKERLALRQEIREELREIRRLIERGQGLRR